MKLPKTILSCFTGKWVIKVDNGFIQSNPKYIAQNHIEYGKYCYDIALTDVNATIRQTCMNALKPEATINKKNNIILKQRSDIHNQTAKVLLTKIKVLSVLLEMNRCLLLLDLLVLMFRTLHKRCLEFWLLLLVKDEDEQWDFPCASCAEGRNIPTPNVYKRFVVAYVTAHNEQRANPHVYKVELEDSAYIFIA